MPLVNLKTNPGISFFIIPENGFTIKNDTFYQVDIDNLDEYDLVELINGINFGLLIGGDPDSAGSRLILQNKINELTFNAFNASLTDLNDVEISSVVESQFLVFIDGKWKNKTIDFSEGGGSGTANGVGYSGVVESYDDLPDAFVNLNKFYYVKNSQGTRWLPGSLGGTYRKPGTYFSTGSSWTTDVSPFQANQIDVDAGVNNDQFITPLTLENAHKWTTKADKTEVITNVVSSTLSVSISNNIATIDISSPISINNGGTGAGNKDEAFSNLVPDQFGLAGTVMSTNGTHPFWSTEITGGDF